MQCVVMKFGGACFRTREHTQQIAQKIVARVVECGRPAVVVVSARSGVTDALLEQMRPMGETRGQHVRDMMLATGELQSAALLAAELVIAGHAAEVVPPWTVFHTNATYGDATIDGVHADAIRACFARGVIPLVPGFIGGTVDGSVTTLGRGGTDYSAVALGLALHAEQVELYKAEVDGVYDADPHTHPTARRFRALDHRQAVSLAQNGAKVLACKAAELALRGNIPIRICNAFHDGPGTDIGAFPPQEHLTCPTY
jgi:aspartate kinase